MGTWMQRMIAWIQAVRIKNGFFTPALVDDAVAPAELNKRDYRLFQIGQAMMKLSNAAEVARKGTEQAYEQALLDAGDFIQDLYIGDTSLDGPADLTNREAFIGKLCLVNTEVCEAMEAAVDNDVAHIPEELADTYIRLNDIVGELKIDIEQAITLKMQANALRQPKHGKLTNL